MSSETSDREEWLILLGMVADIRAALVRPADDDLDDLEKDDDE